MTPAAGTHEIETSDIERSADFYASAVGRVNQSSVVNACARLNAEVLDRWEGGRSALFLGLGEGGLLDLMAERFTRAVAVEASATLVAAARARFGGVPHVSVVQELFERFETAPGQRLDCLLGNHVLEHLEDPVSLIRRSRNWLSASGLAIFTVPNATSLHRRIGVAMGLLREVHALGAQDLKVGHRRVYDLDQLVNHVKDGGYEILESGGFNVKLVSQQQMVDWPPDLHDAIYRVSRGCPPDLCSNVYVVARA